MSTPPSSDVTSVKAAAWPEIYAVANRVYDRAQLTLWPDPEDRFRDLMELVQLASQVREYALTSATDLEPLWSELRKRVTTLDFLMAVTADLFMECETKLGSISAALGEAVHAILPSIVSADNRHLVTDDAFVESTGVKDELIQLYVQNPWFTTLMLLRRAGCLSLRRIMRELA